jgi:hypothetical protein
MGLFLIKPIIVKLMVSINECKNRLGESESYFVPKESDPCDFFAIRLKGRPVVLCSRDVDLAYTIFHS